MTPERGQGLSRRDAPETYRLVRSARRQGLPVRRERHGTYPARMSGQNPERFGGGLVRFAPRRQCRAHRDGGVQDSASKAWPTANVCTWDHVIGLQRDLNADGATVRQIFCPGQTPAFAVD